MISISKRELFIQSWELFKKNAQFFFNVGILLFVIQHMIPIMLGAFFVPYSIPYFIFHLLYLLVTTCVSMWIIMQILNVLRSQTTDSFKDIFKYFPLVFRAIGGSFIITFSLVVIGMLLFSIFSNQINVDWEVATLDMIVNSMLDSTILPIIALGYGMGATYVWIKAYFFIYYIMDQNQGAFQSIKSSLAATSGYEGDLFIVWIMTIFMNFIGILLYGVGLIFTMPYTLLVLTMLYSKYLLKIK